MLLIVFLAVISSIAAHHLPQEGDPCFNHIAKAHGCCLLLEDCPAAAVDLENGSDPQICAYMKHVPIVCCVIDFPLEDGLPPLEEISAAPVPVLRSSAGEEECPPLPEKALNVEKTGQKAWDYCIDLANIMFTCADSSDGVRRRVELCAHSIEDIIIGGDIATPNEFPHMALLGYGELATALWQCGGTLVSEKWVLTAAHCLYSRRAETDVKFVRLGSPNVEDPIDESKTFNVVRIVEHPDRDLPQTYNDLSLLQLDRDATFGPSIIPACLHIGPANVETAVVTGWGVTTNRGNQSNILQEVTLEKFSHEECNKAYPSTLKSSKGIDNNTQICYGSRIEIKDSCQGDSGGPLQIQNDNVFCTYTIIGIVSMGKGCANPGIPGIYTRVSVYIPWIESVVWP